MYNLLVQNRLTSSDKIYVSESKIPNAGRGVFAKSDIKKGEVIEKCPFVEISQKEIAKSRLVTYLFFFGKEKERAALALGFGSLYNHSENPNAEFEINSKDKIIIFTATKDIKRDEEITFNYYGESKSKSKKNPLWFEK